MIAPRSPSAKKPAPSALPLVRGRALSIGGADAVAETTRGSSWSAPAGPVVGLDGPRKKSIAPELLATARAKHASVAAYARLVCQLLALGAPARVVDKTQRAMGDQLRHATMAFGLLASCGEPLQPRPLPEAAAPMPTGEALAPAVLRDVIHHGCVTETLTAHWAARRADVHASMEIREYYNQLAEDGARHAALAFETLTWLLADAPSLAPLAAAQVAALEASDLPDMKAVVLPLFEAALRPPAPNT
ncbi:MAG: hypothetical protein JNL38_03305 [Myxococcales bacterium]|nr:hypothetical protein [Myxococcales bacterium]